VVEFRELPGWRFSQAAAVREKRQSGVSSASKSRSKMTTFTIRILDTNITFMLS